MQSLGHLYVCWLRALSPLPCDGTPHRAQPWKVLANTHSNPPCHPSKPLLLLTRSGVAPIPPGSLPSRRRDMQTAATRLPAGVRIKYHGFQPKDRSQSSSAGWGKAEVWEQVSAESSGEHSREEPPRPRAGSVPSTLGAPGWGQAQEGGCLSRGEDQGCLLSLPRAWMSSVWPMCL